MMRASAVVAIAFGLCSACGTATNPSELAPGVSTSGPCASSPIPPPDTQSKVTHPAITTNTPAAWQLPGAFDSLNAVMAANTAVTASLDFNQDLGNPHFFVQVTSDAGPEVRSRLAAAMPPSVSWEFRVVQYSTDQVDTLVRMLDDESRNGAEGTGSYRLLREAGVTPIYFSFLASRQYVEIVVTESSTHSEADLTAQLSCQTSLLGLPPVYVTFGSPPVPAVG